MKEYVAGFLFSIDRTKVALISKLKPEWQKGLLNGIGGKVEEGESYESAMFREFKEEAGAEITSWKDFCICQGYDWKVIFFKAFEDVYIESQEEEQVGWVDVRDIPTIPTIDNLKFLIPMALHKDNPIALITEY